MARELSVRETTVAAEKAHQPIWTTWMQEATAGLSDDSVIHVYFEATPWGNFAHHFEVGQRDYYRAAGSTIKEGTPE